MFEACCGKELEKTKDMQLVMLITRLILSGGVFALAFLTGKNFYLFIASYMLSGLDILYKAIKNIFKGELFDENFLMALATVGAFIIGDYPEGAAVMLFFQAGELLQEISVGKSRKAIKSLINILPEYATLPDGTRVAPESVSAGDEIIVTAGEKIPLDGEIIKGAAHVDVSALTGEPMLKDLSRGDAVLNGFICQNGVLTIKVTKPYDDSAAVKILKLTEQAVERKSQTERFITRFAKVYTPAVTATALLIATLPPIFFHEEFTKWIYKAFVFLVVSCPCALVISIPLGFFGGIGRASKQGILIKGSNYLDLLAKANAVVFDKTGTLTKGTLSIKQINEKVNGLLEIAAYAEFYSNHPMAKAIVEAYGAEIDATRISDYVETAGMGVTAKVDGISVAAGNDKFIKGAETTEGGVIHFSIDGKYAGNITFTDEIKPEATKAVEDLHKLGIKKTAILTGDNESSGSWVASSVGIDKAHYSMLPQDKLNEIEKIKKQGVTVYVGDGINDSPALALADVGVAMGGLGSDAAIEAADAVIMSDSLAKLPLAVKIARMTHKTVWQNIILSIGIKVLVMALATMGKASMWHAVFADVGVALIAILNTTKLLMGGNKRWQ
ncbi:MAG: cadmium-translocating P-type ATPase [Firmicutes bacterium]|nr:cadmium-translocating P-type ATPase [Bacillota bacterium]